MGGGAIENEDSAKTAGMETSEIKNAALAIKNLRKNMELSPP
jgi:hypothetical protein